jgi:sterol desaturase/sphingolipid hydroxylase (fatty acid hydroxylase superfamily)
MTQDVQVPSGKLATHSPAAVWKHIDRGMSWIFHQMQYLLLGWPARILDRLLSYLDHIRVRLEGSIIRSILSVTLFPLFIALTLFIGFSMTANGISAVDFLGTLVMFSCYGLIFMPLERIMPWSMNWLKGDGDAQADIMFLFGRKLWSMWITQPLSLITVIVVVDAIGPGFGKAIWPSGWNPVVQVFLLLVVKDFFRYWYHRWMHEVPFFWRWHSVHHGVKRLYWFNGTRSHPLEGMTQSMLWAIPLAFVQAPLEIIFVTELLGRTIGRFQHTNMDLRLGFLDYIFSTPRNHRWHHSKSANEGDSNYGGDVILWDHLFGTFYMPKDRQPSDQIGIGTVPDYPSDFWGLMKAPFVYHKLPKIIYEEPGWRRGKKIKK